MKKQRKGYSITAKADKKAEVWIFEEISEYYGISAKQFVEDLRDLGKVEEITIHLNSPGGEVFEGFAIYNTLKASPARKVVSVEGMALSIASVIAMAGDEINMSANALMMIHRASTLAWGNAEDLRKSADLLEKLDGNIVKSYARTKKEEKELYDLLSAETWMTADEAKEMGFIDNVSEALQAAARFDLDKYRYKKPPQAIAAKQPQDIRQKLAHLSMASHKIRAASGQK